MSDIWLNKINWSDDGLVQVVTQEAGSNDVLMVAWMNREALKLTVQTNEAHYWSRSRKQVGGIACHTGRHSCFFNKLEKGQWEAATPILKSPDEIYRK